MSAVTESGPEKLGIVIYGADSRMANLVIRAAAEREDVEIAQVNLRSSRFRDDKDGKEYLRQLRRDSIYPSLPGPPVAAEKLFCGSPKKSPINSSQTPTIALGAELPRIRHDFTFSKDPKTSLFDMGRVVYGDASADVASGIAIPGLNRNPRANILPAPSNEFLGVRVVEPVFSATLGVLKYLDHEHGLVSGVVLETRRYEAGQALTDQTGEGRPLLRSKSAALGILPVGTETGLVAVPRYTGSLFRDEERMRRVKFFSHTANMAAGALATVAVTVQDRIPNKIDVKDGIIEWARERMDEVAISTADVVGDTRTSVINPLGIHIDGQSIKIDVLYDPDWSRAHALLDTAKALHELRTGERP